MSDPLPNRAADRTVLCRNCGHVFSRKYGACPKCGTPRPHKRPKRPWRSFQERVEERLSRLWRFLRHHRHYFIYVPLSVVVAVSIPKLITSFADTAPGTGPNGGPPAGGVGLVDRVGSAFANFGQGIVGLVTSLVEWTARRIVDPVVENPVVVVTGLLGAVVGILLARRQRRRRHRHNQRSRHRRVHGPGDADGAPPPERVRGPEGH